MEITKALTMTAVIGALILSGGPVQAEDIAPRGPIPFTAYDEDGDGRITEREFNTIREQRQETVKANKRMGRGMEDAPAFSDIDTNNDGEVSPSELQAMQQMQQAKRGMGKGMGNQGGKGKGPGPN